MVISRCLSSFREIVNRHFNTFAYWVDSVFALVCCCWAELIDWLLSCYVARVDIRRRRANMLRFTWEGRHICKSLLNSFSKTSSQGTRYLQKEVRLSFNIVRKVPQYLAGLLTIDVLIMAWLTGLTYLCRYSASIRIAMTGASVHKTTCNVFIRHIANPR